MTWRSPVPFRLVPTHDSESFASFNVGETGLPLFPHKGAFAVPRKFHVHEGVDLYVPEDTPVTAVEDGIVVDVQPFTGEHANTPWWENTCAVLVEGATGVVVYGEVRPRGYLNDGEEVRQGDVVGFVKRVLRADKGRPMSMLHLELHGHGFRGDVPAWEERSPPPSLRDPTPHLLDAAHRQWNCEHCDSSVNFWRTDANPSGCGSCNGIGWTDNGVPHVKRRVRFIDDSNPETD